MQGPLPGGTSAEGSQLFLSLCLGFQPPDLRFPKHYGIRDSLVGSFPLSGRPTCSVPLVSSARSRRPQEDNQATILVVKKGYPPQLRHVSRTHKVNLGCISEQLAPGSGINVGYLCQGTAAPEMGQCPQAPGHPSVPARDPRRPTQTAYKVGSESQGCCQWRNGGLAPHIVPQ